MRKAAILFLFISLAGLAPILAQETTAPPQGTVPALTVQTGFTYNPEGRRDPFKDLLAGRDLRERAAIGDEKAFIDDLVLFGIVKNKNVYTALIGMPQGFPMFAKVGEVRGRVRPVHQRDASGPCARPTSGILLRPRDIIKEITEELVT
jgi:hypothetical protein